MLKLFRFFKYQILYLIYRNIDSALKLSSLKKNSLEKIISVKFFNNKFKVPFSISTLSAMAKLEKKNENFLIYEYLGYPNIIIDVGSNIGYWIFPLFKKFEKHIDQIFCFEPSTINFNLLKFNLSGLNKFKLNNYGLNDLNEKATLGIPIWEKRHHNTGLFSIISGNSSNFENVTLKKFDDIFKKNFKKNFYLMKIDVEGLEHKVILGSKNFLTKNKRVAILIELNQSIDKYTDSNIKNSLKLLSKLGYKSYILENKEFKLISSRQLQLNIKNNVYSNHIFKNF